MPVNLKGKIVLITGASSGFGEDAGRLFAAEGAKVILAARRVDRLQDIATQLTEIGADTFVIQVDITSPSEIQQAVQKAIDHFGRIDILFNNAGFGRLNWFEELDFSADIRKQIEVNLIGLMEITQAVLPFMIKQRSGHIINMSSVSGFLAAPLYSGYAASKFGVRGFTDALRRETSIYGVKVSGIYPGFAHTEFGQHTGSSTVIKGINLPSWTYMSSKYVAQHVVKLARHPRSKLIIPWWFVPALWADAHFPSLVDYVINQFFIKKYRQP